MRVASLILVLGLVMGGCFEPPLPEESLEMRIDLDPGATHAISIALEVTSNQNAILDTWIDLVPAGAVNRDVEIVLSHDLDGRAEPGWPDGMPLERDVSLVGTLTAVITNTGTGRATFDVAVGVGAVASAHLGPTRDEVSISLAWIDE